MHPLTGWRYYCIRRHLFFTKIPVDMEIVRSYAVWRALATRGLSVQQGVKGLPRDTGVRFEALDLPWRRHREGFHVTLLQ